MATEAQIRVAAEAIRKAVVRFRGRHYREFIAPEWPADILLEAAQAALEAAEAEVSDSSGAKDG